MSAARGAESGLGVLRCWASTLGHFCLEGSCGAVELGCRVCLYRFRVQVSTDQSIVNIMLLRPKLIAHMSELPCPQNRRTIRILRVLLTRWMYGKQNLAPSMQETGTMPECTHKTPRNVLPELCLSEPDFLVR